MHACPKWHAAFTDVPFFFLFIFPDQRLYIVKNMCLYTHIRLRTDCVKNYIFYQITLRMIHFYTNREQFEVLTGYLLLGCQPGGDWADTLHWTKVSQSSFPTGSSSSPNCFRVFFLTAFLEEALIRNII